MNTGDPFATSVAPGEVRTPPGDGSALAVANEVARLANQLFASFPLTAPASPLAHGEPSARAEPA